MPWWRPGSSLFRTADGAPGQRGIGVVDPDGDRVRAHHRVTSRPRSEGRRGVVRALINSPHGSIGCTMHPMPTKPSPPRPTRISVPVSPDTRLIFEKLSRATGRSLGSVIAEWLDDTSESAGYVALKFEEVRGSTRAVSAHIHAYALGLADETGEVVRRAAAGGPRSRGGPAAATVTSSGNALEGSQDPLYPPSSNTGGKVPGKGKKPGRSRPSKFPLPAAKVQAHADTNGIPPKARKS